MAQDGMAKPLDRFAILVMIALSSTWGGNQVAAKIALHDFGPITQCALRNGAGAALVAAYAAVFRPQVFRRDGTLALGLAVGALYALEFILLFFAVERTTAARAIVATSISAPLALMLGEPFPARPSAAAVSALLYQGVLVVGFTYLIWFWILKRYRAPELSALTFVSPVVGVLAGWLLLRETPTPLFLLALAGVAGGIVLVSLPARSGA